MYSNSISNHHKANTDDLNTQRTRNSPGLSPRNAETKAPVNDVKDAFSRQFSKNAAAKDAFHQLMRQTFSQIADPKTPDTAPKYNYNKAEALRQQAVKGDLSWLPETKVLSNSDFSKAQLNGQQPSSATPLGAFGDDTIMLNESVLSDPGLALRVYAEEAGHALDKVLNQEVDSAGDEGAIFQKLLSGEKINAEQMKALKAENDHGVLYSQEVEFYYSLQAQQETLNRAAFANTSLYFDAPVYMTKVSEFKKTNNPLINKENSALKEYNID